MNNAFSRIQICSNSFVVEPSWHGRRTHFFSWFEELLQYPHAFITFGLIKSEYIFLLPVISVRLLLLFFLLDKRLFYQGSQEFTSVWLSFISFKTLSFWHQLDNSFCLVWFGKQSWHCICLKFCMHWGVYIACT